MRTLIIAAAAGLAAAGCASVGLIDDGGRAADAVNNEPVAGPASHEDFLAETWNVNDVAPRTYGGAAETPADVTGCDPNVWAGLIGRSEEELQSVVLPEPHRIICHGCMVTRDHVINRLNIQLSESGVVQRLYCG